MDVYKYLNWTKTYKYNNLNTYERNLKNDKFERGNNSIQIET
jgi:hypothetical protein